MGNPFTSLVRVLSEDKLLGGRIIVQQPKAGYRTAIDPILLAASIQPENGETVLDVGCGVGTVSLCLAARMKANGAQLSITGVDKEQMLVNLAQQSAEKNGFTESMRFVVGDIASPLPSMDNGRFDHVVTNPPYLAAGKADISPDPLKAAANTESTADLARWVDFCVAMAKPKGTLTMIHRADRMDEILKHMQGRIGDIAVLPLWPKAGEAAKRIIVTGRKDAKGYLTLLPGLVLHENNGDFTGEAQNILQNASPLALFPPKA